MKSMRNRHLSLIFAVLAIAGCQSEIGNSAGEWVVVDPLISATALERDQPQLSLNVESSALADGSAIELELGFLRVSENRSVPGRTIQVEVARIKRGPSARHDVPPIIFLPGGPGFPGVRSMLNWDGLVPLVNLLTSVTDLVLVGQRGIGTSIPSLDCDDVIEVDVDTPGIQDRISEATRRISRKCRETWLAEGVDLSAYSVLEAAADVRDAIKLLGYKRVVLWGTSFGSHWSMAVMRRYPEIVERAVLSGLEGPNHTYDMPSGVFRSLQGISNEASNSERLAGSTPKGGWLTAFQDVVDRLSKSPVTVDVEGGSVYLDGDVVRGAALGYTAGLGSRSGITKWPTDVNRLVRGEYEPFAKSLIARVDQGFPPAAFFTLDCGSGITASREVLLNNDPARAVLGNLSSFYQASCPLWNVDLGDEFRTGFTTDIPTLLVHGTYDVNTPYTNVQELIPAFTDGHLVTVVGGSHGALGEALNADRSFAAKVVGFLMTGSMADMPNKLELPPIEWLVPGQVDR